METKHIEKKQQKTKEKTYIYHKRKNIDKNIKTTQKKRGNDKEKQQAKEFETKHTKKETKQKNI